MPHSLSLINSILAESKGYMDRQSNRGIFSNKKLFLVWMNENNNLYMQPGGNLATV
ncbi:hypothetical protein DPMN_103570 [Dreissena polymorpha]|uniref:Uncharacterized protein n=1 Tax=Dreissena polymorpha TaxID=45954 RepID=A0A9D4K0X7_DREPO|nr:hypothetical protein DPMN_103570 [Dreissena polymorpha]